MLVAWALVPSARAAKEKEPPPHPLVGQKLVPQDVDWEHPLYQTSFDAPAVLKDWRLEGGKSMRIADGKLILDSRPGSTRSEDKANHLVCWLVKEVPGDFLLEFSLRPQNRKQGLNIVFFNARGIHGESIFSPALRPRDGLFAEYITGDLNNYHVSYWAGTRGSANIRKNYGFHLVSVGRDLVAPAPAAAFQTVRVYKRQGTIRLMVDNVVAVAYDDDGKTYGPVWNHSGWIGLRQMAHTVRCEYEHLKVFPLLPAIPVEKAPHAEIRSAPSPAGTKVTVNPPPLLWPVADRDVLHYRVRLSRDKAFSRQATIIAEGLRWACCNPHRKLENGRWYWQYAAAGGGQQPAWSEPCWFDVDDSARPFVTPPAEAILRACPKDHPRLLASAAELPELRRRAVGTVELKKIIDPADRCLGRELPDLGRARPQEKGDNRYQQRNFAKWASKAFAAKLAEEMTCLAPAYLLTGEEKYGREAARRATFIAALDPDAETSSKVSDFADGSCMHALALAYDSCHDLLSAEQRQQLRQAIRVRAGRFFQQSMKNMEVRIFNAHAWQHILMEAAEAAFATLGELPEADAWVAYFYELWVSRFPAMGGDDGGWAEGFGYEGVNMETMLRAPALLERLGGVDFFDRPWYRHAPYFLLYGWPPGSASAGFGDGAELPTGPHMIQAHFAETLARRFRDPYVLWYSEAVCAENRQAVIAAPLLLLDRLRSGGARPAFPSRPPRELPQARAFDDVGLVVMHSQLAAPKSDVFLAFCSCPFGGCGHMHPCQNAFNLLVGGQRLLANSGYYISDGDEHYKGWYSTTRAHNAILIDGRGEGDDTASYGRILRFADTPRASYCLGDATHAYHDAGLTKARRHVAFLRPSTIVIYDELEADHPARWSWLLHSPARLTAAVPNIRLEAEVAAGRGRVEVFASGPLRAEIDNRFDPPAKNWRHAKDASGKLAEYPDQWHATVVPRQPAGKLRFLALIQVRLTSDRQPLEDPAVEFPGRVKLAPWRIDAALDPSQPASLSVSDSRGQSVLAVDGDGRPR
jgi:hypothetical protein